MSTCPKCHRPFNEGNSPNAEECNGTDDDDGLCEAYAKLYAVEQRAERLEEALKCVDLNIVEFEPGTNALAKFTLEEVRLIRSALGGTK
jgi:hypothetical protein